MNNDCTLPPYSPASVSSSASKSSRRGVVDNDFAVAVVVLDVDLEAQGALEALLDFADVGIDSRLGLGFLLGGALGVQQALDEAFGLANRKRKMRPTRFCGFLDLLGDVQRQEGCGRGRS